MNWQEVIPEAALVATLVLLVQGLAFPILADRLRKALEHELETFRHELALAHDTYAKNLDLILEYYARIYRHYRVCQEAANFDIFVDPDGSDRFPKKDYLDKVEAFRVDWNSDEGKLRLLLPKRILDLHEKTLSAINVFTRAIKRHTASQDDRDKDSILRAFETVHEETRRLELDLREFLRTERLLL